MEKTTKPRLVFFQWNHENLTKLVRLHMQLHVKCLSQFFEVTVINEDCDYQQICDQYQPDLTLFESGVRYSSSRKIQIKNTAVYPEIPKLGFHNGDSWCDCRTGFLSDMEHWGIETFFSICTTLAEHTPEIAENLFVWPNFIDADIYRDYGESKIVPVLFSGVIHPLYPWRQQIYRVVSQHYPSLICPHPGYDTGSALRIIQGEQYARTINASWFVPTCGSVAKEIVRKHFEIPASRACLVTEKTPTVEACGFIDMENCVFADENNVLDKLDYLFQNRDKLEKIITSGYELVHSLHTLKQRDQIFQWFCLYKNLKPNQKIIQVNPFDPLIAVENSSSIRNSHIVCNGLNIVLLRQGDEKLWAGKYDEAESLYLRCLDYISWMPEPKLRLALCSLYKGNAADALHWITQLTRFTFECYNALDPDPVEWAYFIISLMCQGKFNEAVIRTHQFPELCHSELDRTRWAIHCLQNPGKNFSELDTHSFKARYSVHQLPNRSFTDWIINLCVLLQACEQFNLAEKLKRSAFPNSQLLGQREEPSRSINILNNCLISIRMNWLKMLENIFETLHLPNPKPSLPPVSEKDYIIRLARIAKIDFLKRFCINSLRRLRN